MSMFRRPGESSSSSSSEASYDRTEDEEPESSRQNGFLSRINTLESGASGVPVDAQRPSLAELRQESAQDVRNIMLHAMLEEKAIAEAAARLKTDPTDPEAQRQGREAYQRLARQLFDDKYASDEFRSHRKQAQQGINTLTSSHLQTLSTIPQDTQALVMHHMQGNAVPAPQPPLPGIEVLSGLHSPAGLYLRGYPDLQNDRYVRDFSELEVVGKGGYGKVYKVKHKLDGSFYAVKRIPVPPAKLAKVQQQGPEALSSMLEEVRSLARFDHANIVRYHNAWLEFTTPPTERPFVPMTTVVRDNRLLEDPANFSSSPSDVDYLQKKMDSMQFEEPSANSGADIVFEASDTGEGDNSRGNVDHLSLREQLSVKRKKRRSSQASQATIATVSSTRSRMSAVEDVSEDFDDEDVEMIPRRHMPSSQDLTTDLSDSMVSHSDGPAGPLVKTRASGPVLTLNVQMSLYESSLAAFLSPERTSLSSQAEVRHCFHACVSWELLSNILAGVEYLHSQGVVHRDLKPANVFLSLSTGRRGPYGSVDLSSCKACPERACVHVVPRIGDFGLVAALDEASSTESRNSRAASTKPVGTEFYRPSTSSRNSDKLDVFALGVMAVELLCPFGTRMERSATLSRLRHGAFPDGFAARLGPQGDRAQQLIGAMVLADEQQRMGCEEARGEVARLVEALRGSSC
ncbi:Non-specific serine/threonine protein kinase [Ascochyta rabiei]|nr:Non-specific serine/threonine protein kinase [Ascochyta rabiei]UPX11059.1 Non-specific serine/threonine protein kinase [Ascochyta rabiei]